MTNWRNQAIAKIQDEIDRVRANYAEAALDAAIEAVIEQLRSKQSSPVPIAPAANENIAGCKLLTMNGSCYDWSPLRELGVGGSVLLPYRMLRANAAERKRAKAQASKSASDWCRTTGYRFSYRETPHGIRVWRVA